MMSKICGGLIFVDVHQTFDRHFEDYRVVYKYQFGDY